ncbi:amidase [Bradyrhizobium sp. LTSPM299]|uniref:amidase n=1 Tax=Bradyrhizobium sp. LTSPM299 TaxID=1619233 RepID=UPI0005CAED5C|nr:amidase [Bradyrhizobium sp. LTSPM299]KJC58834.1 amidase [Bradyrhizobium sp. LTSPM299]
MISLADLQQRIERGALSPDTAIGQSLEAIGAQDKTIGAFVRTDANARAQSSGPLRGIAVGIKDIIDTADFPTEMGAQIYRGNRPRADAPVVMALKRAGATIVGKTTTTAFAANDPTATLNPHNHGHTPGGSSAGSAAAVGAGMIPLALGTQTGGSVIRPASFCGVAAIKPSYRLLPTVGVKCFSWTLDTVGLFGAGVRDVAAGLSAMTHRPELLVPASVAAPRIGVVTQAFADAPEASGAAALQKASRAAEKAGALVRELAMPEIVAEAWRIHPIVQEFEAHQSLAWEYGQNYDAMPPLLRGRLDESKSGTPAEYDAAMDVTLRARRALAAIFDEVDVLLTLSAPGAAPAGLASTGDPRYNRLWTLMGVPCVNVPALVAEGGLPVGVTVIAKFGADAQALAAASFVEEALKRQ